MFWAWWHPCMLQGQVPSSPWRCIFLPGPQAACDDDGFSSDADSGYSGSSSSDDDGGDTSSDGDGEDTSAARPAGESSAGFEAKVEAKLSDHNQNGHHAQRERVRTLTAPINKCETVSEVVAALKAPPNDGRLWELLKGNTRRLPPTCCCSLRTLMSAPLGQGVHACVY